MYSKIVVLPRVSYCAKIYLVYPLPEPEPQFSDSVSSLPTPRLAILGMLD